MAQEKQIPYDDQQITAIKDWWMPRGDTRELPFEHTLGAAAAVKTAQIELKAKAGDGNYTAGTVVVSLTKADHSTQWDFTTSNEGIVTFAEGNTATIYANGYDYAVQLTDQSDRVFTVMRGTITLQADVVDNDSTSPYPSWDTLSDLQTDISQMAACGNLSWLTVAATGGAQATLDVENGAIFTATDNIRLVLDSGSYEDDTIASIIDNELTLSGTIAGEAAIGNVVRIL